MKELLAQKLLTELSTITSSKIITDWWLDRRNSKMGIDCQMRKIWHLCSFKKVYLADTSRARNQVQRTRLNINSIGCLHSPTKEIITMMIWKWNLFILILVNAIPTKKQQFYPRPTVSSYRILGQSLHLAVLVGTDSETLFKVHLKIKIMKVNWTHVNMSASTLWEVTPIKSHREIIQSYNSLITTSLFQGVSEPNTLEISRTQNLLRTITTMNKLRGCMVPLRLTCQLKSRTFNL